MHTLNGKMMMLDFGHISMTGSSISFLVSPQTLIYASGPASQQTMKKLTWMISKYSDSHISVLAFS